MPVLDGKKYADTKDGMRRYRLEKKKKEKKKGFIGRIKSNFKKEKIYKKDGRSPSKSDLTNAELEKKKYEHFLKTDGEYTLGEFIDGANSRRELERRREKAKKVYSDGPIRNPENKKRVKAKSTKTKNAWLDETLRRHRKKKKEAK
jgi:hypothetical protein